MVPLMECCIHGTSLYFWDYVYIVQNGQAWTWNVICIQKVCRNCVTVVQNSSTTYSSQICTFTHLQSLICQRTIICYQNKVVKMVVLIVVYTFVIILNNYHGLIKDHIFISGIFFSMCSDSSQWMVCEW